MRSLFIVAFLFPLFANTQKLVLLDRNFHHPVNIVDSISMEEAAKGAVAVYAKDINSLFVFIQGLIKYVADGKTDKEEVFDLNAGHSKYVVKTEKTGSTNHYNIVLNTDTGNFKTAFALVSHQSNKRAVQRLTMFMDYLRNNISVLPGLETL
jgi:hypothetical protein